MTYLEKLENIFYSHTGQKPNGEEFSAMEAAYELGKSSKKCKEDKDNPYNIDYKRQTKIDFE